MRYLGVCIASALLGRYAVSVDSSETDRLPTAIEILVGSGSYTEVQRDCSGRVLSKKEVPYTEFGISASYTISDLRLALSAGVTTSRPTAEMFSYNRATDRFPYVAPQIGIDTKYIGIHGGYLFDLSKAQSTQWSPEGGAYNPSFSRDKTGTPIGALRVGKINGIYFYANYGTNMPISVGTGLGEAGVAFGSENMRSRFWLGMGGVPDDGLMMTAKGDLAITNHLAFCARGHIAPWGEGFGYGLAGGLKFQF